LVGAPAAGYIVRVAQRNFDDSKVPLLGVMGAFVFAAQMINFPVGVGTSGHLVGGALLACTLGPAAASVVMTAILAIQALVFQDGGVLALGANVFNMAIAGVFAGYLPYYLWGRGRARRASIFFAGALSVGVSAVLALAELLLSGVRMPSSILGVSLGLFVISALIEGAITMAVMSALEAIQPSFARPASAQSGRFALAAIALVAIILAAGGVVFASTSPDGIERLAMQTGISQQARRPASWAQAGRRRREPDCSASPWPADSASSSAESGSAGAPCHPGSVEPRREPPPPAGPARQNRRGPGISYGPGNRAPLSAVALRGLLRHALYHCPAGAPAAGRRHDPGGGGAAIYPCIWSG
jgi:cobalt/nickel transport system permease protein